MIVPNQHPTIEDNQGRRLAVIGEAPGSDEDLIGLPFQGYSGQLLRFELQRAGISPESCFIGNVCQLRPPDNDLKSFDWNGPEITSGIEQLKADLAQFKPNCVLILGRTAFRVFNPERCYPVRPTKDNPDGIKIPISDWRGSVFHSSLGYKSVGAFHPAYILRAFGDIAYLRLDIRRAVRHASFPEVRPTVRTGTLRPTFVEACQFLTDLLESKRPSSFDIEGYSDAIGVTMLGIAPTATSGMVIPFHIDSKRYWSEDEEPIIWSLLSHWLADPICPKRCHNAFYELLVLGWRHGCVVDGIVDDTMMKHWEVYNELEKSLGVCVSIWIEEPYYKDERHSSGDTKLGYNFKDSACTEGVNSSIESVLVQRPRQRDHYRFNISLIPALNYMHLRGCKFDSIRAAQHITKAETELSRLVSILDRDLGHHLSSYNTWREREGKPLKTEWSFNPKSADDKEWFIYEHLGMDVSRRWGRSSKEELLHRYYKKTKNETLKALIQAVSLRTRISDIEKLTPNADGRIRTSYDLVSTVTARLNSRESSIAEQIGVDKNGKMKYQEFGTNLQNVTKPIRDCFVTDGPENLFFQADLEGADAWTVAADLAAKGDDRMLNDLKHKVKPSKVLLGMIESIKAGRDPSLIAKMPSDELKAFLDTIIIPDGTLDDGRPADWFYTCCKKVQHGSNYLGKPPTIAAVIFKDSDGLIDLQEIEVERMQRLYFMRYDISKRKDYIISCLQRDGTLHTAAGTSRKFFGLRNQKFPDDDIVREAMASEPQTITTYATNLALKNLWYDPANRRKSGALFIEPLLQVHDALAGQFPGRLRDFARERIRSYFENPITINGITLTIPVDIRVGTSWGSCKEKI